MELKLINSQNDSGAIAPHIVRVWQGTTLVLEHYAVPDAAGTVTQKIVTLPAAVYDIEVVNPNLFESRITPIMLFYNPANNYNQEELQTPRRNVLACQSERYSFDGNQIVNLTVETTNVGINNTNVLYSTVGTTSLTSGNDLDGNAIASGSSIPSVLTFKKIADNTLSAMTLPNKKMWLSTSGTVDASAYVPYVAATGGVVSTNPTPVITADTNNPNTAIRWNTPSGMAGISTKTVELYNGTALISAITFTGTTNLWENLPSGAYKIRYTINSNSQPFSAFSNVIVLGSLASDVPFVTVVDATLNSAGTAEIRLSGVVGATVKVFLGGLYATSGIVDNNSRVYVTVAEAGNYTFTQLEAGKSESAATAITTIGPYTVVTPSCNLNGTFTISDINYSAGILTYAYHAANFGSARWRILQGTTVITNGLTGAAAGNGNPQISVGTIPAGDYTFDITGLSCIGTTSGNFTVASGGGGGTVQIMDYDLGTFEACSVAQADIEFGSSATNDINTVTDWIQGTRITKDINLVADSTFFWIRDKNNHAVVSPVFQKI